MTPAALGMVPFAGSLLAEIAGNIIPNQRIDRLVKLAEVLNGRLDDLERDFAWSLVANENFTDLIEEGCRQAARSLSDERREYIASLISNSLKVEEIEYVESKHLLRMLDELSDVEVLWSRFYLEPAMNGDLEFRSKHEAIFRPVAVLLNSPPETREKSALQNSYKQHLAEPGLLDRQYKIDTSRANQSINIKGYHLSSLGRLMLKQIGLAG